MLIPILLMACGKKGPPLAPFVRIPAAVQTIDARRVGDAVYVTLTIPAENIDASTPADVRRVEVYAYTGTAAPARGLFAEGGTLVGTVDVAAAPPTGDAAPEVAATATGVAQGAPVTVRDTLTAGDLTAAPPVGAPQATAAADAAAGPLRRFYTAFAFSGSGVPGPPGMVADVPLTMVPDPPSSLDVSYTADALTLRWQPASGLIAFLLDRALPFDPPPPGVEAMPPGGQPQEAAVPSPPLYNVYREIAPDPLALPTAPGRASSTVAPPAPVNPAPLAALTFTEPIALDERERCYTVRAVRGTPPDTIEGTASRPICLSPIDVFPPASPRELATIASPDAISLIWEPNAEPDVAGYVILRGDAGGDTLAPLTREPITEAQFTDGTVAPGVRYVYHVIAVDRRLPLPNASAPAIIEATAR